MEYSIPRNRSSSVHGSDLSDGRCDGIVRTQEARLLDFLHSVANCALQNTDSYACKPGAGGGDRSTSGGNCSSGYVNVFPTPGASHSVSLPPNPGPTASFPPQPVECLNSFMSSDPPTCPTKAPLLPPLKEDIPPSVSTSGIEPQLEVNGRGLQDQKYNCKYCCKMYDNRFSRRRHERCHESNYVQCSVCDKTFRPHYIKRHIREVHGQKGFACQFCKRTFSRQSSLKRHETLHILPGMQQEQSNDQLTLQRFSLYPCNQCGQCFRHRFARNRHERYHKTKLSTKLCPECGKNYREEYLSCHLKFVHGEKIYACQFCEKAFARHRSLLNHLQRCHSTETNQQIQVVTCPICFKQFPGHNLKRHVLQVHGRSQECICNECGVSCASKASLRRHMALHEATTDHRDAKKVTCTICHSTMRADYHSKHMRSVHSAEKESPHELMKESICAICNASFSSSSSLRRHMAARHDITSNHPAVQRAACEICRAVVRKDYLKKHIRTLHGDKEFSCQFCSSKFSREDSLKRHELWHLKQCEALFRQSLNNTTDGGDKSRGAAATVEVGRACSDPPVTPPDNSCDISGSPKCSYTFDSYGAVNPNDRDLGFLNSSDPNLCVNPFDLSDSGQRK